MINFRKTLCIIIPFWFFVAAVLFKQLPYHYFSHDFGAHVEYTQILVNQHRMPKPNEGWELHQPPLYYLIASLLSPQTINNSGYTTHVFLVKIFSVLCGAVSLAVIAWLLGQITDNLYIKLLVLMFTASTPKFVLMFTTYNNDSLANMLSICIFAISYKLYKNWTRKTEILLLIVALLALYTKFTALVSIGAVIGICCVNLLKQKQISINHSSIRVIRTLVIALLLLLPLSYFQYYRHTGELFPSLHFTSGMPEALLLDKNRSIFNIVLPISILEANESKWSEPWVHSWPNKASKRNDYWSFNYITSVIGEHIFNSPAVNVTWFILITHLLAYVISLRQIFKSEIAKLSIGVILLSHAAQIYHVIINPYSCNMDFRHIAFIWIGWAVLYTFALLEKGKCSWILSKSMLLGIAFQIYLLATVTD